MVNMQKAKATSASEKLLFWRNLTFLEFLSCHSLFCPPPSPFFLVNTVVLGRHGQINQRRIFSHLSTFVSVVAKNDFYETHARGDRARQRAGTAQQRLSTFFVSLFSTSKKQEKKVNSVFWISTAIRRRFCFLKN